MRKKLKIFSTFASLFLSSIGIASPALVLNIFAITAGN